MLRSGDSTRAMSAKRPPSSTSRLSSATAAESGLVRRIVTGDAVRTRDRVRLQILVTIVNVGG